MGLLEAAELVKRRGRSTVLMAAFYQQRTQRRVQRLHQKPARTQIDMEILKSTTDGTEIRLTTWEADLFPVKKGMKYRPQLLQDFFHQPYL